MNRSRVFPRGVLTASGCALSLIFTANSLAATSDTATFQAVILPGSCDAKFDASDISLPSVGVRMITPAAANTEIAADDAVPNQLRVTCNGYPGASIAKLTVTSTDGVTIGGAGSWFRNAATSAANTALALRVQYRKVGDNTGWSGYLSAGDSVDASTTATGMHNQSIPFRISMWCAPSGGQTYVNCGLPDGGKVSASFAVSVDYP